MHENARRNVMAVRNQLLSNFEDEMYVNIICHVSYLYVDHNKFYISWTFLLVFTSRVTSEFNVN
jgi:hypothetical protein